MKEVIEKHLAVLNAFTNTYFHPFFRLSSTPLFCLALLSLLFAFQLKSSSSMYSSLVFARQGGEGVAEESGRKKIYPERVHEHLLFSPIWGLFLCPGPAEPILITPRSLLICKRS
jgi:hypothetical protein